MTWMRREVSAIFVLLVSVATAELTCDTSKVKEISVIASAAPMYRVLSTDVSMKRFGRSGVKLTTKSEDDDEWIVTNTYGIPAEAKVAEVVSATVEVADVDDDDVSPAEAEVAEVVPAAVEIADVDDDDVSPAEAEVAEVVTAAVEVADVDDDDVYPAEAEVAEVVTAAVEVADDDDDDVVVAEVVEETECVTEELKCRIVHFWCEYVNNKRLYVISDHKDYFALYTKTSDGKGTLDIYSKTIKNPITFSDLPDEFRTDIKKACGDKYDTLKAYSYHYEPEKFIIVCH